MVLTLHHLGISQSERIVWLLEELNIDYKLVKHNRDPILAPKSLSIPGNDNGKAPFFEDSDAGITRSESAAICEYIINKYGSGKLSIKPTDDAETYAQYLHWFHYSNGTFQPAMSSGMLIGLAGLPDDHFVMGISKGRVKGSLQSLDDRLGRSKWLAGEQFTAADIMTVFSLTTQRYFGPRSLAEYKNILRFLQDVGAREAYQRAMQKGDPEMKLLLGAEAPEPGLIKAGGIGSDIWKK